MDTTVKPDRVLIATQFVPRFLDLPLVKLIKAGETWEPGNETYDYIEVQEGGRLRFSRTQNTTLRVTTLIVLPGGILDIGVEADPIPASIKAELVIRDVPIDTVRDPFQWANGVVNFGRWDTYGAPKLEWTPLSGDISKGATSITLPVDPVGWRVGDDLLFPDSLRQMRRESPVSVAAISGRTITFSKPLDFEHNSIRKPDGTVVLTPRAANLSRNIVIRSEGTGTPGHTVSIGDSILNIHYVELRNLGRTRNVQLNNTSADLTHIGTNQVAKYSIHFHHMMMGMGSSADGNVLRGGQKWGLVVHASHDIDVDRNIAVDFTGAGFVTEDGYEVRNCFCDNLAAYCISFNADSSDNNPGGNGNGFWFRGRQNKITGNEAWSNTIGINDFGVNQVVALYPSIPGGVPDTNFDRLQARPIEFRANVVVGNYFNGMEIWGAPKYPNRDLVSANNGTQVFHAISSPANPYFVNPTIVGTEDRVGILSPMAYVRTLTVEGGYVGGNGIGIDDGGANILLTLKDVAFQNVFNLNLVNSPQEILMENVMHIPLGTHPPKYIEKPGKTTDIWLGGSTLPYNGGNSQWVPQIGSRTVIKNWQGTGKNYQLLLLQQRGSLPAWPSTLGNEYGWAAEHRFDCPEAGLTMFESWTKYGMSLAGDVVNDADIVPLEGVHALAREGMKTVLGRPRAIVTSPTLRHDAGSAIINGREIRVYFQRTGEGFAGDLVHARVDGGEWQVLGGELFGTDRIGVGVHNIELVRFAGDGHVLANETFQYRVGPSDGTPPPPPPPPPPPVDCVQGDWIAGTPVTTFSPWVTVSHQERQKTVTTPFTRQTLTSPANGGVACGPATKETKAVVTETQPVPPVRTTR